MNDTMDTTLTGSSSVSVNNPLHHSPPTPHWGVPGGGVGNPRYNNSHHQQHSQTPTAPPTDFVSGKTKSPMTAVTSSAGGGDVLANTVMEQLRPPDAGDSDSVGHPSGSSPSVASCNKGDSSACGSRRPPPSSSVVTASSGAVTVISVQHGGTCNTAVDKVHPDDGE